MIAVLDRQGREGGGGSLQECRVSRAQLAEEHAERPAIRDDVVHVHEEHMVLGGKREQRRPDQRVAPEIEGAVHLRRQPVGDLRRDREGARQRGRPLLHDAAQRVAFHQLHREVGPALGLADVEDRDDVGVVEPGDHARLVPEARQAVGVGEQRARQQLQRHLPAEPRIERPVDLPHPSSAEQRADVVVAERGANWQTRAWLPRRFGLDRHGQGIRQPFYSTRSSSLRPGDIEKSGTSSPSR